jgi:hypothetical protein
MTAFDDVVRMERDFLRDDGRRLMQEVDHLREEVDEAYDLVDHLDDQLDDAANDVVEARTIAKHLARRLSGEWQAKYRTDQATTDKWVIEDVAAYLGGDEE